MERGKGLVPFVDLGDVSLVRMHVELYLFTFHSFVKCKMKRRTIGTAKEKFKGDPKAR